jgi:uncharacterized membrane protein YphA (DoxX/SURF4 family)
MSAAFFVFADVFWLRRIVNFPAIFGTWSGFAEQFAPVVGAVLCYVTLLPVPAERTRLLRRLGGGLVGLCLLAFGVIHFDALAQTAALVPAWLPLGQRFWAIATGAAFLVFGLAMVAGVFPRIAARAAASMLGGFALLVWFPRVFAHPERQNAWAGTAITVAVAAAAWMAADSLDQIRS